MKKPLVIGHRGAMGHVTENTLASIQKAMDLEVDMIEIDVFRIKSGEIVVFHDETVDRLTNGHGNIESFDLLGIRQLVLEGGYQIPILEDVLKLIDNKVPLNIELKGPNTADKVNDIMENYIRKGNWSANNFIISSFNWDELEEMRKISQTARIAVLTEDNPLDAIFLAKKINAEAVNPYFKALDREVVGQIHDAGLKINTWTVNEPKDIKAMKELGVDGIFTNYPERAK